MRSIATHFLLLCTLASPVAAADTLPGPYPADVLRVYDGDTFTASVQVWPLMVTEAGIRVRGVDTPEIRGACEHEKELALAARDRLRILLAGGAVTLHDVALGKYAGRVVATVMVDGLNVADTLILEGLGRAYDGGSRPPWCPQE